jgi:hypothetical protein
VRQHPFGSRSQHVPGSPRVGAGVIELTGDRVGALVGALVGILVGDLVGDRVLPVLHWQHMPHDSPPAVDEKSSSFQWSSQLSDDAVLNSNPLHPVVLRHRLWHEDRLDRVYLV